MQRLASALFALLAFGYAATATAATRTVTSLADDGGAGTLRTIIGNLVDGDTIVFQAGLTGTLKLAQSTGFFGSHVFTLTGPGSDKLTLDGNGAEKLFELFGPGDYAISGVTVKNFSSGNGFDGGAFNVEGAAKSLTLTDVVIADTTFNALAIHSFTAPITLVGCKLRDLSDRPEVVTWGRIIYVGGTLTLRDTQISGNNFTQMIETSSGAGLVLERVSYTGNTAERKHFMIDGPVDVRQSTFAENSTGPALFWLKTVSRFEGITVANNIPSGGPLVFTQGSFDVAVRNSILQHSGQLACSIQMKSSGHNLVSSSSIGCQWVNSDLVGDPGLSPTLALNGGKTLGYLPTNCSSAIDAGDSTTPDTLDQAGKPRVKFTAVDIGAVEVQAATPNIANQPAPATQTRDLGASFTVYLGVCGYGNTFQWKKGATAIAGATSATFFKTVADGDAGTYSCTVTRGGVATNTGNAVLVIPPPTITTAPVPQTKYLGQSLTFSVVGKNVASYAWKKVGSATVLGTAATLTYAATATADYTVTLTSATGSVTSTAVTGTIIPAPTATVAVTQAMPVATGTTVNLTSTVTNAGPSATYLWTTPAGASLCTTANCNLTNAQPTQSGTYTFKVTTPAGTASKTLAVSILTPIVIATGKPADQSVLLGKAYELVVTVTGTAPTYQWFKGTTAIAGATGASYGEAAATAADAGGYLVKVTNGLGTVTSRTATLTVLPPPTVTIAADGALPTYATQKLMLEATATAGVTYQWKKGGVAISGAVGASFGIASTAVTDAGSYTCTVTNAGGTATSNAIVVTLIGKPAITTQPVAKTIYATQALTLSVVATNAVSYQWRKAGSNLAGATAATYTKASAATTDAGSYDVVVTNPAGSVTSSAVTVTVTGKPTIATLPTPVTVYETKPLSIAATVTNGASYVWKKGTVAVTGQTTATFTKTAVAADAGTYTLDATNPAGTTTSTGSIVTVKGKSTATITGTLAYYAGQTLTLNVTASDAASYVWKLGATQVGTAKTYTKAALVAADAGSYTVAVTNPAGTTTSAAVVVTVTGKPTVGAITGTTALYVGQNLSLSATVTNGVSQRWQKGGVDIAGATATTYSKTALVAADAGSYTIVATNPAGETKATAVAVTVTGPPTMKTQPVAQNVFATKTLTLSCVGNNAVSYKWQKGSVDIAGATSSTYTKTAVLADAGSYRCVVTNPAGQVFSNAVAVTVYGPPAITTQPIAQTVFVTKPFSLTVAASGQDVSYQWRKGGVAIADAEDATYTKAAVAADAGNYDVVVTNDAGSVTSTAVAVVVDPKPSITTQPTGSTVFIGDTISMSVVASGKSLTYQWKKGSTVLAGATAATFTKTATAADAGSYTVVVTNPGGSTTSAAAVVNVNGLPAITTSPADTDLYVGQTLTLTVAATGAGLSYQWRKNDVNIANATATTYTKTAALADAGDYDCIVTNGSGSTTSGSAEVTVYGKPAITTQPTAVAVYATKALSLPVVVSSPGPSATTYAWKKDGVAVAGTTATYAKNPAVAADAGSYVLTATNPAGSTSTTGIVVTVDGAPVVGTLAGATVFDGQALSLTTTATGKALTFQWSKDNVDLVGEKAQTYSVAVADSADAGVYRLKVTNPAGTTTAGPATVVVNGPPVLTQQPLDATVYATKNLTLKVTATGVGLSYQWWKDGVAVDAATQATYSRTATLADAGNYVCVVTNGAGSVESESATVVVLGPPVAGPLAGATLFAGETLTLTAEADGQGLVYQWKKGTSTLAGATADTYSKTASVADAGDYSVVITNGAGSVTAGPATVVVHGPPVIGTPPATTSVFAGHALTLTVAASGEGLTYQWQHDGDLGGEVAASLTRTFEMADAGDYTVVVTNPAGSVSATATVTVHGPPVITTEPTAVVAFAGAAVQFAVVATGEALTYQWRRHGVALEGATDSTLTMTAALADADDYDVVVTNPAGSVQSDVVVLTVNGPPSITADPVDTTLFASETLTLTVEASGAGLSYQWSKDGEAIAGATSATFTTTASAADAGDYTVTVTNGAGHVDSEPATVTVDGAPVVTGTAGGESRYEGQGFLLSCGATGVGATYQWLKDGVAIANQTGSTFSISATSAADAGAYACVATNPAGTVTTPETTLAIKPARTIVTQPTAQELFATQTLTLTVVAAGTELTYLWTRDGDPIAGATSATYTVAASSLADAGQYAVFVSDPSGALISDIVSVVVHGPPVIDTPPADATLFATQAVAIEVGASGLSLAYSWTRDGTPLATTTPTFSLAAATVADAGHYVVTVENPAGSVSADADVVVKGPPVITTEPADATVFSGQAADFTVAATGLELSYAWTFAATPIPDATTSGISVTAAPEAAGTYQVTIANPAGSVTSRAAVLTVEGPPEITVDPDDADLLVGEALALHVAATGRELTYQWRKSGSPVAGATTPDLTIEAVAADDAGWYDCVVSNPAGSTTSGVGIVDVIAAPHFTDDPRSTTVALGASLHLEARAEGGQITYQWRKDGTPVVDATDDYYDVEAVTAGDLGQYDVVATNRAGTATSAPAVVTLETPDTPDTPVAGGAGCGGCNGGDAASTIPGTSIALAVLAGLALLSRRRTV